MGRSLIRGYFFILTVIAGPAVLFANVSVEVDIQKISLSRVALRLLVAFFLARTSNYLSICSRGEVEARP